MQWDHGSIEVNGIGLHYLVAGEGPPVLLLHGLGASSVVWWENIVPLSQHFRVYALDLPGHGDSEKPRHIDYSPWAAPRLIQGFLGALGIQRASLVGNSAGGLLAVIFGLSFPERVERLVLVDTAGLGRELPWFLRFASLPLLGQLLERPNVRNTQNLLRSVLYNPRSISDGLVTELMRVRNLPGAKQAVLQSLRKGVNLLGLRRHYLMLEGLKRLQAPILVIWGEQDRIIPVTHAHRAAREVPTIRVHIFPQCGHWPQMERPEEFNRLVLQFLQGALDGEAEAV